MKRLLYFFFFFLVSLGVFPVAADSLTGVTTRSTVGEIFRQRAGKNLKLFNFQTHFFFSASQFQDEKFHNLSSKGKEEQLLESSDEEDSEREVQADFEFFDPKATNFHGVKILLQNYLDDKEWDQTTVGTVVKVADDEDEALFALVTALNL